MTDTPSPSAIATFMIDRLPQSITELVLRDTNFCADFDITTTSTITLTAGFSFDRDQLYQAVQRVASGLGPLVLKNQRGEEVEVRFVDEERPHVVFTRGKQRLLNNLLMLVSADAGCRQRALHAAGRDVGLPKQVLDRWTSLVADRPLTAQEMEEVGEDVGASVAGFLERLEEIVRSGRFLSRDLVPTSEAYFEQLLFEVLDCPDSFSKLADEVLPRQLEASLRRELRQLSYALAIGATDNLVPIKALSSIDDQLIVEFLASTADLDPFSAIAAITICVRKQKDHVGYREQGRRLVTDLLGNRDRLQGRCELFSALYALSLSRLSHYDAFRNRPVHMKRLAAFAHASLCVRVIAKLEIPPTEFMKWCLQAEGSGFLWSALLDKREAPRWRAQWIDPEQTLCELVGRLRNLVATYPQAALDVSLTSELSTAEQWIKGQSTWAPLYPGPLEGGTDTARPELSQEETEFVKAEIEKASSLNRCLGIIAISPIWAVPDQLVDEAIRELDRNPIPEDKIGRERFAAVLSGLAHLAGLKRSAQLADLVASLGLRARASGSDAIQFEVVVRAVIESAAAFEKRLDQFAWLAAVFNRLAFSVSEKKDALLLRNILEQVSEYHVELGTRVSRALNAVRAYVGAVT